jgi:hypothetical protein
MSSGTSTPPGWASRRDVDRSYRSEEVQQFRADLFNGVQHIQAIPPKERVGAEESKEQMAMDKEEEEEKSLMAVWQCYREFEDYSYLDKAL